MHVTLIYIVVIVCCIGLPSEACRRRRRRPTCSPVPCRWENWSNWAACGASCGSLPKQSRTRGVAEAASCNGLGCSGAAKETRPISSCGVPSVTPLAARRFTSLIIGGNPAKPYSWPWQVSLRYVPVNSAHVCGGSVVHSKYVVTAAHCVAHDPYAGNWLVRVGEYNLRTVEGPEQDLEIEAVIVHPQYDPESNDYDVALLQMKSDIQFTDEVKPVCIPEKVVDPNTVCVVTGWGQTQGTGNSNLLNQVRVPIVNQTVCKSPDWWGSQITDRMVCAGLESGIKGACYGDSGGPLVCETDGIYYLHGIVSFGSANACKQPRKPTVFARVTSFADWFAAL